MTRPTRKVNNKDNLVHIIENIVNWHFCDDGVKRVVDTLQYTRVSDNNENMAKHKTGVSQGSLKESSHKNILAPKPHILDSNEVLGSSFWSQGPKLEKLGLKVCPPETSTRVATPRTSRGGAMGPWGLLYGPRGAVP